MTVHSQRFRRRARRASVLAIISCVSLAFPACSVTSAGYGANTSRSRLDKLYPPGSARLTTSTRNGEYLGFALLESAPELDMFTKATVGEIHDDGLGTVTGFDFFEVRERSRADHTPLDRTVCDDVFFNAQGRILRAYRRFDSC